MKVLAENDTELLYWVDEEDRVLGSMTRKQIHDQKLPHREVALLVHDGEGRVLFQKRSMKKRSNPGLWSTSVAGHIEFGETAPKTIAKEAKEEIGLLGKELQYLGKEWIDDGEERYFKYWFITEVAADYRFELNEEEVDEVGFWDKSRLEAGVRKGESLNRLFVERAYLFWDNRLASYLEGNADE